MIRRVRFIPAVLLSFFLFATLVADEGMYPLSEISRLDLQSKGLEIPVSEIYNPDGVSLVDAICQVGGGTGEFVSPDGLILTNHHIAFAGVTDASTPEHDYLREGFTAATRDKEIPARGYVCRITEDYRDVSTDVLAVVTESMTPAERSDAIRDKMKALAEAAEQGRENISCEVSEMFPGKTYVLFTYRIIRDVRLVYVPPLAVGNFGGETDNWIWPRHTGDFSFLRAYVAPDGSTAAYAEENVPFKPKRYIKVAPEGVSEGDFVFILGYPGRTYRHKTADYINLYERTILPYLSKRYDFMIETMEEASREDRALQLEFANMIKGLANATKNYKGKIQGLHRLDLVEKRRAEEVELQRFIDGSAEMRKKFGTTLQELHEVYRDYEAHALQEIITTLMGRIGYYNLFNSVLGMVEKGELDEERVKRLNDVITKQYEAINSDVENELLATLIRDFHTLPKDQQPDVIARLIGEHGSDRSAAVAAIEQAFRKSDLSTADGMLRLAAMDKEALAASKDPFVVLGRELRALNEDIIARRRTRDGELKRLEAAYIDAKMAWQKKDFIPDANSTLRLTYGYIRGYAPADATYYSPQTTLRGIVEKNTGEEPFNAPDKLIELYNTKNYDRSLEDAILKDIPVAMLYNMDTTGGNSGSPVLNARGELVGVNFDRAFEATVNDYQWSEDYSRSIGVDIRYVLFVAKHLGGAGFLLDELGVD
ncbi:MAG: S46 family peptidase [Bacteroidetes bacterium]|nr:S46 family peptidase [Bacteroidota bacterium]